jgi:hypothetical protein
MLPRPGLGRCDALDVRRQLLQEGPAPLSILGLLAVLQARAQATTSHPDGPAWHWQFILSARIPQKIQRCPGLLVR